MKDWIAFKYGWLAFWIGFFHPWQTQTDVYDYAIKQARREIAERERKAQHGSK